MNATNAKMIKKINMTSINHPEIHIDTIKSILTSGRLIGFAQGHEKGHKEGYDQGYEEGSTEGREAGHEELKSTIREILK